MLSVYTIGRHAVTCTHTLNNKYARARIHTHTHTYNTRARARTYVFFKEED